MVESMSMMVCIVGLRLAENDLICLAVPSPLLLLVNSRPRPVAPSPPRRFSSRASLWAAATSCTRCTKRASSRRRSRG